MPELPELKTGDRVVIYSNNHGERWTGPEMTIDRETKTQLIAGGRRFRKRDLEEIGYTNSWGTAPKLMRPEDPIAIQCRKEERGRHAFSRTVKAVRAWEKGRTDVALIEAAIFALDGYRQFLEAVK